MEAEELSELDVIETTVREDSQNASPRTTLKKQSNVKKSTKTGKVSKMDQTKASKKKILLKSKKRTVKRAQQDDILPKRSKRNAEKKLDPNFDYGYK